MLKEYRKQKYYCCYTDTLLQNSPRNVIGMLCVKYINICGGFGNSFNGSKQNLLMAE